MTKKMTYYQQLRTIRMPVLKARERLLRQIALKFEQAGNARAHELKRQNVDWGDMWHTDRITDSEMRKLVRGYLKYHNAYHSMRINVSALQHEVYKLTGDIDTSLSVAELEEAHIASLRAKHRSA